MLFLLGILGGFCALGAACAFGIGFASSLLGFCAFGSHFGHLFDGCGRSANGRIKHEEFA